MRYTASSRDARGSRSGSPRSFGGATNLLDASWDTAVVPNAFGDWFFEPGPGRAFYVGVTAGMAGP